MDVRHYCPRHQLNHGFWVCICKKLMMARVEGILESAVEASKTRIMFLRYKDLGMITDENHPTLKIRKQMRKEISDALNKQAKELNEEIKDGKY